MKIISVQMVTDTDKDQRKVTDNQEVGEMAEEEEKPSTPRNKQDWEKNIEVINLAHQ